MNKQIEEMARIIEKNVYGAEQSVEYAPNARNASKELFSKGYRRQEDVAREIFDEIEKSFIEYYTRTITYSIPNLPIHLREEACFALNEMFMKIVELKKKYGETADCVPEIK